jgi:outer membrane protein
MTLGFSPCRNAGALDVFHTEATVPAIPAAHLLDGDLAAPCVSRALSTPLPLFEAIEHTLCDSARTRAAWQSVKAAAASVGVNQAAYLPTLDGSANYSAERYSTAARESPQLQNSYSQPVYSASLSMTWLLYDFGGRRAALRGSRELLVAARATQDATLQAALLNTAKDYYHAQAAAAQIQAARRIEADTRLVLDAAGARYTTGVAPITDQLQATTAHAQALYQQTLADGAFLLARGALAVDMNLSPETPLVLPDLEQGTLPDLGFVHAVHDLVDEATRTHPTILAAKAQWEAALADVDAAKAAGLPKLQLSGAVSASDSPVSASLGQPELPAVSRQRSIGLSLSFPLFAGFSTTYRIRQAKALADEQAMTLRDTEQQVALNVWSSFQALQTDTDNLRNTDEILKSARQAFEAAQQRYKRGVGSILEMLGVESSLATAEQLQIQAQSDWRAARLTLAASLGSLGTWAIK